MTTRVTKKYVDGITATIELVTPEAATMMLAKNPNNRHVTKNHVAVLAREINMGDWQITGQGITISDKGELLDGQHRLLAVELSGKSVYMLVVRGVRKEAMNVIDTVAKSRSASDIFSMRGVKHPITVAAGINVLNKFSAGGRFNMLSQTQMRLTQAQFDKHLEVFPQLQEWASWSDTLSEHVLFKSIVTGLGVVFGLAEKKEEQARDFFWKVDSGEMLTKNEPIYELRKQMIRFNANRKTFRIRPETIVWLVIKTWNAHVSEEPFKRLAIGGREQMPLVLGFDPTVLPYYTGKAVREEIKGSLL